MITKEQSDEMRALLDKLGREEWTTLGHTVRSYDGSPLAACGHTHRATPSEFARFIVLAREMLRPLVGAP